MLDQITPVVLTYNEEANIGRCLERLSWARQVLVVDSHSEDATVGIASSFENVRTIRHGFENFADQWRWALTQSDLTEWILALDADYVLTPELIREIGQLRPSSDTDGYRAQFDWAVYGKIVRRSLYPPLIVLFRKSKVTIARYGHAQKAVVPSERPLSHRLIHDDRKPLGRWFENQIHYAKEEAQSLVHKADDGRSNAPLDARDRSMRLHDRLRRFPFLTTFAVPFYLLFLRGLILDGKAGAHYVLQRTISEAMISLFLIDTRIRGR